MQDDEDTMAPNADTHDLPPGYGEPDEADVIDFETRKRERAQQAQQDAQQLSARTQAIEYNAIRPHEAVEAAIRVLAGHVYQQCGRLVTVHEELPHPALSSHVSTA